MKGLATARKRLDRLSERVRAIEVREHALATARHHLQNDRDFWKERVAHLERERARKLAPKAKR